MMRPFHDPPNIVTHHKFNKEMFVGKERTQKGVNFEYITFQFTVTLGRVHISR